MVKFGPKYILHFKELPISIPCRLSIYSSKVPLVPSALIHFPSHYRNFHTALTLQIEIMAIQGLVGFSKFYNIGPELEIRLFYFAYIYTMFYVAPQNFFQTSCPPLTQG